MKNKKMYFIVLIMFFLFTFQKKIYADNIEIDGNFEDWNNINAIDTSASSIFFSKVAITKQNGYLFIYALEKSTDSWCKYYTYTDPILIDANGNQTAIRLTRNWNSTNGIDVRKQTGYSLINGAFGIEKKNQFYEWEVGIPLTEIGDVQTIKLKIDYSSYVDFTIDETEKNEPETSYEETTENETTVSNQKDSIVIDGSFEEWKSYPHTLVTNWNMPQNDRTEKNCRQLAVTKDDDYLYIYIKMISGWDDPYNGNEYLLTAAGKTIGVYVFGDNGQAFPNYNMSEGIHNLNIFYKNGTSGISDQTLIQGAEGKLTIYGRGQNSNGTYTPDEVEIKIPINIFNKVYGLKNEDIKEITISNPNLLDHGITVAGSSTGPFIGIAMCIGFIAVSTGIIHFNKSKKNTKQ